MPKTLPERIFFTIVMAAIMVYGMIVYNVALNTGGVTNATFVMALHEMPIMVPIACVLEFFVVEKLATGLAFMFMRPTDRPQFITYALLRPALPVHLPAGVPPRCKTGGLTDFRYAVIINMYRSGCNTGRDAYTNFIYRAYKVCTMGHF